MRGRKDEKFESGEWGSSRRILPLCQNNVLAASCCMLGTLARSCESLCVHSCCRHPVVEACRLQLGVRLATVCSCALVDVCGCVALLCIDGLCQLHCGRCTQLCGCLYGRLCSSLCSSFLFVVAVWIGCAHLILMLPPAF